MEIVAFTVTTFVVLQLSALCTTVYLHRSITHGGLQLHPAVAFLMHLELLLFTGIQPRKWAAVHRKHHHFSDEDGDPHSPVLRGLWTILVGNYFFYRREANNPATVARYTPGYRLDLLDRLPLVEYGVFLGWGIFAAILGWKWGTVAWLTHIVLYVTVNAMINGLGHAVGYRNYSNGATNLRWLAWISAGEGLHNNHHEYPSAARFSMRKREFDPAWPVIRLLERCGLAKVRPEPLAKAA